MSYVHISVTVEVGKIIWAGNSVENRLCRCGKGLFNSKVSIILQAVDLEAVCVGIT